MDLGSFWRYTAEAQEATDMRFREGNCYRKFFTVRVVKHSNRFSREAVAFPSLELDKDGAHPIWTKS